MSRYLPCLLALAYAAFSPAQDGQRLVWQPVLDTLRARSKDTAEGEHRINPFVAYTHLGTDFGFHGPGERHITWHNGSIHVHLPAEEHEWAGMWFSLAGLAADPTATLNFENCYPSLVDGCAQPSIAEVMIKICGKGTLKMEVKSVGQETLWTHMFEVDEVSERPLSVLVPAKALHEAKFLNWTAEPGSDLCVTSLDLGVHIPALPFDRYVLLASYAKMARCYSPTLGFVKDRAHVRDGDFNSIPATGLFALATATMSQPDVRMVRPETARTVVRKIWASVSAVPTGEGLLPHFVKHIDGRPVIHPGTEFSTVDTAIFYQSLFMASQMLDDHETTAAVLNAIHRVQFGDLLLPDGAISHGLRDDGHTMIKFGWRDWGGETALVMLMARLTGTHLPPQVMQPTGKPWQGTGFIAEIQSLLYPDFDSIIPDAVSKVNWREARVSLLNLQKAYFPNHLPDSMAARMGLYGLSAGEGAYGTTYEVDGVDLPEQSLIHPHYLLMSATLEDNPQTVYDLLHRMEHAGYLTPWGLVENVRADGSSYLPMISGLNAGFEVLGAYHLLAKACHQEDSIYKISGETTELRDAVKLMYPGVMAKK